MKNLNLREIIFIIILIVVIVGSYFIIKNNMIKENSVVIRKIQIQNENSGSATTTTTGILPFDSGVEGTVTLGPTCPVLRNPPVPGCDDKPFSTTIQVIRVGSPKSSPFATVESDKDGKYKIILPPGQYALQPVGDSVLPRCQTLDITIEPSKILKVDLSCDTGIR